MLSTSWRIGSTALPDGGSVNSTHSLVGLWCNRALQVPVHTVVLDMRNLEAVAQMPHQLPDQFKEVDILINNAGLALGVTTVDSHDIEVR